MNDQYESKIMEDYYYEDEGMPKWKSFIIKRQDALEIKMQMQSDQFSDIIINRFLTRDNSQRTEREEFQARPIPRPRTTVPPKIEIKPLPMLDKDVDFKGFIQWKKSWKNYATMAKLEELPMQDQISQFHQCCTPPLLDRMVHSMGIPDDTDDDLAGVLNIIEEFLRQRRNLAFDRQNLLSRKQNDGEGFEDFYTELCKLAETADLRDMTFDQCMANLILVGIEDENTRQKLLEQHPPPTLLETLNICRNAEKGRISRGQLTSYGTATVASAISRGTQDRSSSRSRERRRNSSSSRQRSTSRCGRCGYGPHMDGKKCSARDKECRKCHHVGHYADMCFTPHESWLVDLKA